MPFGMKNSPATFQSLVNKAISGLDGVGAYIDDVIIYSDTWEEDRSTSYSIFLRQTFRTFLGHVVKQGQVID